ncbi:predicted protein [Nematostella vectensis]|uniref:Uncharacterized protein n=1 Tax=Nematostella vectensis TaxID=45351 RepID=A7T3R1_NEMVE|nr:predicted protein [Nematostella vectensis]|eukprot:XP_001621504.1 hypothetical protein NEMVEDRAFT_v1g221913 [Nematostella vectensis]
MACVLELIGNWIMCKPSRILIVTTRFTELIHSSIAMIISSFGNIPVMLLTSSALDGFVETKGVEVYVASQLSIQCDFPWGLFSYVIEYEGESMIKSKVTSKLLDHVLLRTQGSIKVENAEHDAGPCDGCSEDPYVLIGSTRVTLDGELLHFLESRYNILIYERDYSQMRSCSSLSLDKMMLQPDLMIVHPNTLREMVSHMSSGVGMVHQIPFIVCASSASFAACVDKVYFGTQHAFLYLFANTMGLLCANGMSTIYNKKVLDELGNSNRDLSTIYNKKVFDELGMSTIYNKKVLDVLGNYNRDLYIPYRV